jgi:dCTP deaminase
MFLSDVDLDKAIKDGDLIFEPSPDKIDPTSIDLHLDKVDEAKIWDIDGYIQRRQSEGHNRPELRIGTYNLAKFASDNLRSPPEYREDSVDLIQKRLNQIIVRPGGFVLWQTKEFVGTPPENTKLICFVEGKSTRARTGILVHMTAPTIHSTWAGQIVLEIANVGPFDLVLQENDVIAQLTVARITSSPVKKMAASSVTFGQTRVDGKAD